MNEKELKDVLKKYLENYSRIENEVDSFINFCKKFNIDFPLDRIIGADSQVDGSYISVIFKNPSGKYSIEVEIPTTNIGNSSVTITIKNIKTDDKKYKTPSKFYIDKSQDFNLLQYIIKFLTLHHFMWMIVHKLLIQYFIKIFKFERYKFLTL